MVCRSNILDSGVANWLGYCFLSQEVQPRVLAWHQRCTHENPQYDTHVDRGRFDPCENVGVELVEHSDPREPLEVHYWGLGYLSSLTEVVEEDMTTEDETSSDESDSVAIDPETNSSGEDEGKTQVIPIFTCTDIRYRSE